MARRVRDHRLDTRAARGRLARREEPYWRILGQGVHLGYFKGERTGKWVVRARIAGTGIAYRKVRLGEADDFHDANGQTILSFAQAQKAALAWAERNAGGQWTGHYSVGNALTDYLKDFRGKSLDKTRARIERVIRPSLGQIEIAKLTSAQINDWHRERGQATRIGRNISVVEATRRARSTANRDLTILRAALNHAFHREVVASDLPWRRVKPFQNVEGVRLRCLSVAECKTIIASCAPEFRPMIQAALLTGARYGELCRLCVSDHDSEAATLRLRETKSGVARTVYLNPEGNRFFRTMALERPGNEPILPRPDGAQWGPSQQSRYMAQACAKGQVSPSASFHDLRRTYGAQLALKGVPMAIIAEALGHKDERITRRHYAHLAPSYVADTIRNALNPLGIEPSAPATVAA